MMSEDKTVEGNRAEQRDLTVVSVPEDQVQAVLDFVAGLEREDAEVSGHMLSGGLVGGLGGGPLAAKGRTLSGCSQTGGPAFGTDWQCSDTDV